MMSGRDYRTGPLGDSQHRDGPPPDDYTFYVS